MNDRISGVLLSVTSLPSHHGIGDFGKGAYEFIDLLKKGGFKLWQILPLNPIGYGHSPYQPYSSYAIDEQFIDLDELVEKGFLKKAPLFDEKSTVVRYEEVRAYKLPLLREAFKAELEKNPKCLEKFKKENPWVKDWSVFSMLHRRFPMSWDEWPEGWKNWILKRPKLAADAQEAVDFEVYLQYTAYRQWDALHAYAKKQGIAIIGDIPFYVGYDSCDVWANQDTFLLDPQDRKPTFIAGVPPDYFSATGQRWGNPIYDWKHLEDTDFAFIEDRIRINAKVYDIVRLDHFRAFDTYWKIPATCDTAIGGEWIEAPGYKLFDSLFKKDPSLQARIIAEDLGDLRDEVLVLRDHYDFPGMNVIEFTFHDCELAHKGDWNRVNSAAYLGTHDNDTMLGFFYALEEQEQGEWMHALSNMGIKEGTAVERMIRYCLAKPAKWAILTMQDILEKDTDCRTNVPSTVNDRNWTYKLADFKAFEAKLPTLAKWLKEYKRA